MKRFFDLSLAIFLLPWVLPIVGLISVLIWITDGGPIFFRQVRVGKDLKRFKIFKFKSMRPGQNPGDVPEGTSLEELKRLRAAYSTTNANDRRVTRLGAFLRKTSLDEVPQIFNVLVGDMSFVGPRPDAPVQEADYRPEDWKARHRVRPGITGLAQTRGRSLITPELRLQYDLEYASGPAGLMMDLKILVKTLFQALRSKGSN